MLGTKHKLNNKGLKKKHFTGVVKNIRFSHTVKNISFSCKILKFFIVQREKKKWNCRNVQNDNTSENTMHIIHLSMSNITIINKYGLPTCNSPIVSSSFLRKFDLFYFFLKHKVDLKIYCNMIHMHFWPSFLLSTFQIDISKK